jgi:AcrR family transcriptional regulator
MPIKSAGGKAVPKFKPVRRDPARTKLRILAAALEEFSRQGFAGGRVDVIARRAGINKRMLYHYFGDKQGLFREVMHRKMVQREAWLVGAPEDPLDILAYWFQVACNDTEWVRLLEWEALQLADAPLANGAKRRASCRRFMERIRKSQRLGRMSKDFDAGQMALTMMALTTFPLAFPQMTWIATGMLPTDPKFQRQRVKFLSQFAAALRPATQSAA